jgi:hypothetical protein
MINCQGVKVDTYKWENNASTHIVTNYYKDLGLLVTDGMVAPPPPPPPLQTKSN